MDKLAKGKNDNTLYVTSRCSNRCIMCCQPPSAHDDSLLCLDKCRKLIDEADKDTDWICITGGEPTLIGDRLFSLLDDIKEKLPDATCLILSNGRRFSNSSFLKKFYEKVKTDIVLGIPLHSDNPEDHDLISGSRGSFYETLKGLHNLGLLGFEIELRVIILNQNFKRLPQIAEFIIMNLPFVCQVSFMGLEVTGYANDNYDSVWVNPKDYVPYLSKAVYALSACKIRPFIYNVPLCLLPNDLWTYSCKSISEWKKMNLSQCSSCSVINDCCGVFSTSKIHYPDIHPIITNDF